MDRELARTLGHATRGARSALGLTQEDVAERAQVSTEYYARIERGHALPSVPTLVRLTTALGVSADYLLGGPRDGAAEPPAGWGERDSPELRRVVRRLRRASPQTVQAVSALLRELERRR